jgi:hypothetical protein
MLRHLCVLERTAPELDRRSLGCFEDLGYREQISVNMLRWNIFQNFVL